VRKNTLRVGEDIPEDKYGFRAAPDVRSVAEMLAHIAVGTRWAQRMHGGRLTFADSAAFGAEMQRQTQEAAALKTKAQIVDALRRDGDEFAAWLDTLSDEVLAERVAFPPPMEPSSRTRFEMLLSVKEHEMHHRAQLMLVERLLGVVPHLTRERQAAVAERQQPQAQPRRA
jgi:uncharacterized damage-inducible protein DinB